MRIKAFVVIDTNVLVSAMYSNASPPTAILEMIESGNIIPIFDKRMLKEYYNVFKYDKFKNIITDEMLRNTIYTIVNNGICINDVKETKTQMKDLYDIPFFEVKESSQEFESMLVTGNIKHFPKDNCIVTPKELIVILQQMERFIINDLDYEKAVDLIVRTNLDTPKYISGDELLEDIFEDVSQKVINRSYFNDYEER